MHQRRKARHANLEAPSESSQYPVMSPASEIVSGGNVTNASPTSAGAIHPHRAKHQSPTALSLLPEPSAGCVTISNAGFYVLSGSSQPLLTTLIKEAGMADPSCQVYMLFYYLFPSFLILPLFVSNQWPQRRTIIKACAIASWDIMSTSLNYTGASLAGSAIFSIIYSSVTVWTAVFSQFFLNRRMNAWQWANVLIVFAGLSLTATGTRQLGSDVIKGSILVMVGSAMHGLTYVMSESIMTQGDDKLTTQQNTGIQGSVAALCFLVWQVIYTIPHWEEHFKEPMQEAGTTAMYAISLLTFFGLANLVHSITFFHTLLHFPGGATSAGVMKGLQAVLVFVLTHVAYCGRIGGDEMCFTQSKFVSLITVCGGILGYGLATQAAHIAASSAGLQAEDELQQRQDGSVEIEPVEHTRLLSPNQHFGTATNRHTSS